MLQKPLVFSNKSSELCVSFVGILLIIFNSCKNTTDFLLSFVCLCSEMKIFFIVALFLVFESEHFDYLQSIEFCCLIRSAKEPSACFLTVFEIVFLNACFADFLLPTASINCGTLCKRSSFPTRFAAGGYIEFPRKRQSSSTYATC